MSNHVCAQGGYKIRVSVVHCKAVDLLDRHARKAKTGFIRLNEAYAVLRIHFHLNKKETWQLLKELSELGLIKLARCNGLWLGGGSGGD